MTEKELAEIEARAAAVTTGQWVAMRMRLDEDEVNGITAFREVPTDAEMLHPYPVAMMIGGHALETSADAAFIAASRTDVPALVAEVRRLREALDRVGNWGKEDLREGGCGLCDADGLRRMDHDQDCPVTALGEP